MLEIEGVTKRFGSLTALDGVSARFARGEIHAVLGENGAGKSTLVSILSGFAAPDAGEIRLNGEPLPFGRTSECRKRGIELVHQHYTLVPEFTVAENFALARLGSLAGRLDVAALARPALEVAERLGWPVEPEAKVRTLPVGQQQRLEILRALAGDARVLLFDEPTAVLSPPEVADLLRVLRQLRDEGRVVVLIAHKLTEVMEVADRYTVLRGGKVVALAGAGEASATRLADWMVGEMPTEARAGSSGVRATGLVVRGMSVKGERGNEAVRGVSFEIERGEVLGIGGVDGNGQVELAEALAGVREFEGEKTFGPEPGEWRIAYVPQDRQVDGLAMGMTVRDNLLVTGHRRPELSRGPFLRTERIMAWARSLIERFEIAARGPQVRVASLSGGNQQKVVVSRTLDTQPDLLVVVNPTRGLDLRAAAYVRRRILDTRDGGAAVALFSTDLDELHALTDRIVFLSRGQIVEGTGAEALVGGLG